MFDKKEISTIGFKVYKILSEIPESRDDDRILYTEIWKRESAGSTLENFITEMLNGTLTFGDTIGRARRYLQSKYPHLRGTKYENRHQIENFVTNQLTFFDVWIK